jgi:hypothetical protein
MPEVIADINEIVEKYQNNIELLDLDEWVLLMNF